MNDEFGPSPIDDVIDLLYIQRLLCEWIAKTFGVPAEVLKEPGSYPVITVKESPDKEEE